MGGGVRRRADPRSVAVENFHLLAERQTADRPSTPGRINLLNWDGNGSPEGIFPEARPGEPEDPGPAPTPGATKGEP